MTFDLLNDQKMAEVGESRETWCAVEMTKEQGWMRAQMRHYPKLHLKSSVMQPPKEAPREARCDWTPKKPQHLQKRHYGRATINSEFIQCET